jgi:hypothetical protein
MTRRGRRFATLLDRAYLVADRVLRGPFVGSTPSYSSIRGILRAVATRQDRWIDEGLALHGRILGLLGRHGLLASPVVCVIGDGMTNFLAPAHRAFRAETKFLSVNLPEAHVVDLPLAVSLFPEAEIRLLRNERDVESFLHVPSTARLGLVCATEARMLRASRIDLFVNVASMQEMTHDAVEEYFALMRRSGAWFYCCNRIEKSIKDGELSRFFEYPWGECEIVVDEPCPWAHRYLQRKPLRVVRGQPTWHRLARFLT